MSADSQAQVLLHWTRSTSHLLPPYVNLESLHCKVVVHEGMDQGVKGHGVPRQRPVTINKRPAKNCWQGCKHWSQGLEK